MKKLKFAYSILFGLVTGLTASAQVPQLINYQGRVVVGSTNFDGSGQFKFSLVNGAGSATYWSNDGTGSGGGQPTAAVTLPVVRGLYAVLLGDVTLPNMTAIPVSVFTNVDVRLRVWFNDGTTGFQQFSPDQRLAAVGYAMMSGDVPNGIITSNKLANGAVTSSKIADNAITAGKIANGAINSSNLSSSISIGNTNVNGVFSVYGTPADTAGVTLFGSSSQISTYGSDGQEQIRLWGSSYGEILLNNSLSNNANAVTLSANGSSGGYLALRNTNNSNRAFLSGANSGGSLALYQNDGSTGASLSSAGTLYLYNTNASLRASIVGTSTGGALSLYQADGSTGAILDGDNAGYGLLSLRNTNGNTRVQFTGGPQGGSGTIWGPTGNAAIGLYGENGSGGGGVTIYRTNGTFAGQLTIADTTRRDGYLGLASSDGNTKIYARAHNGSANGGYLGIINAAGSQVITLDSDSGTGFGRITTPVIQITGGSDLSEQFDITSIHQPLKPGMVVCIDPEKPGELMVSSKAYDRTAAGVVSGAGGVNPGMLMGQAGTKADGKHPVALSGRVYCMADASSEPIQAGDLLTTSGKAGHAMKAIDHNRAQGAIIGKAMGSLQSGQGLVLVLVSLQ